jgi:hypothetical protein
MVDYTCFRCGYEATQKINMKHHLNRKNICKPLLADISIEDIKKHYGFDILQTTGKNSRQTAGKQQVATCKNDRQNNRQTTGLPAVTTGKQQVSLLKNNLKCQFCEKTFTRKYGLKCHEISCKKNLLKKPAKTAVNLLNLTSQPAKNLISTSFKCEFCEKTFTRKYGLKCHLNNCKIKKQNDSELESLKKEHEELKDQVEDLLIELSKKSPNTTEITNNITNNTNNTTNQNKIINIHINNYGNENIKYLEGDYLNNLLDSAFTAIPKLIEKIHFNPSHPENHNIKITNKKEPYVKIRKNDKWELQDKKETLETLVDDKYYILVDHYADMSEDKMPEKTKAVMEQFHDSYIDNKELQKDLQKKSEMIILNNS